MASRERRVQTCLLALLCNDVNSLLPSRRVLMDVLFWRLHEYELSFKDQRITSNLLSFLFFKFRSSFQTCFVNYS